MASTDGAAPAAAAFSDLWWGCPAPAALLRLDALDRACVVTTNRAFDAVAGGGLECAPGTSLDELIAVQGGWGAILRSLAESGCPPVVCAMGGAGRRTDAHAPGESFTARLWLTSDAELVVIALDRTAGPSCVDVEEPTVWQTQGLLQAIIDNVPARVFVKDLDGRFILVNQRSRELAGAVIGACDRQLVPQDQAARLAEHDRQVLRSGRALQFEEEILEGGEYRTYLSLKFPLRDASGEVRGVIGVATDITAQKHAERALSADRDEAERGNRAKSEFLSRVSHELRTPLNSILGYGQLMEFDRLSDDGTANLHNMMSSARHLLSMIEDLLEVQRIELDGELLSLEPVHALRPLRDAIDLVRPLAAAREVTLISDVHHGLYRFVRADRQRLTQVLVNVLMNAVNYNRRGGEVRVSFAQRSAVALSFQIADTGVGIRAADTDRIFEPFRRLQQDGQGGPAGSGLGLAVSRKLIEAMGGRLELVSSSPTGSIFAAELDLMDAPPDAAAYVLGSGQVTDDIDTVTARLRILCVEDDPSSLDILCRMLAVVAPHAAVHTATSAAEALEQADRSSFDLLLVDLHLPDAGGEQALEPFRQRFGTTGPVIAVVTADGTPESRSLAEAAGVEHFLLKPIDLQVLATTVRTVVTEPSR